MKRRFVIAALVGLALAPGRADAQTPEQRIEAARRSVAAAGIPISLIDTRVAEGRAKGVAMDRIAAVVERRAASLAGARAAMASAPNLGASDLAAGADALEAGIDDGSLRAVIQGARVEDRPVAIAVLTYLHREAGMPVAQALRSVRAAMGEGSEALRTLPNRATTARERRGPPAGVGPPGGASGGPPGAGRGGGPPAGVPAPGQKPGGGRPDNPGGGKSGGNRPGGGPGA